MKNGYSILEYDSSVHTTGIVALWERVFGYEAAHNDPHLALQKKEETGDGLLFVCVSQAGEVRGTVMGGYDGHRGWIYSLAVAPELQRSGIGSALMVHVEDALARLGCMKINLQILAGNEAVQAFYRTLGYDVEHRVNMGKLVQANVPEGS